MLKSLLKADTVAKGQRVMYRYSLPSGIVTGTVIKYFFGNSYESSEFSIGVRMDDGREIIRNVKSWELMK